MTETTLHAMVRIRLAGTEKEVMLPVTCSVH